MPSTVEPAPGQRLALRWSAPDGPREVVGDVVTVAPDRLTLLPDDGPPVEVARAAIAAARVVPARAVRPVSPIEDLERLAAQGWPGAVQERLGGWLLRAGSGASGRANSCLPLGDPGMPVAAAVDFVTAWYAGRALTPQFQRPEALGARHPGFRRPPDALATELATRGWVAARPTLVLVGDLRRLSPRAADPPHADWADAPDPAWWAIDGGDAGRRAEAVAAPARYLTLREPAGEIVAVGRLAAVRDWVGLSNLTVPPDRRGQGHGRRALEELLAEGARRGARFAYLQVTEDNAVARALYEARGFQAHHRYRYDVPA